MSYYIDADMLKLFEISKIKEQSYEQFEDLIIKYHGNDFLDKYYDDIKYEKELNIGQNIKSPDDLLPVGLYENNYTTYDEMVLLGEFMDDIGFSKSEDYYSKYSIFSNFLNKKDYRELDKITKSFNDLLEELNKDNILDDCLVNELELIKDLKYFENDVFIYIPDYGRFENMDILGEVPNFIYKKTGYIIRYRKGIGRSSYTNIDLNKTEFEEMLYNCRISMI